MSETENDRQLNPAIAHCEENRQASINTVAPGNTRR